MRHLRTTSKYYTGYPKDLGPSRVIHFTSEREFVQLLHQGYPIVVAFTIRCNYAKHLDKVFEEAAAEFYPHVKFMRVECPKYPGFCSISKQKKDYPCYQVKLRHKCIWFQRNLQKAWNSLIEFKLELEDSLQRGIVRSIDYERLMRQGGHTERKLRN